MGGRLEKIRLLVLDVDGTMTDGGIYLDDNGRESKRFSVRDGAGILLARQAGIETVILTGRESGCVTKRAQELGIRYVFQNVKEKGRFLGRFLEEKEIPGKAVAYLGDDFNDLAAMKLAGVTVCPKDAAENVRRACDYVLNSRGGRGAVREFVEMILRKRDMLETCAEQLWGEKDEQVKGQTV